MDDAHSKDPAGEAPPGETVNPPEEIERFGRVDSSQMARAHAMLTEIVRVAQSSRALVVIREANRTGPSPRELGWAFATFGGLFLVTHWWIALPASAIVAFWRTRRRAHKLRKSVRKHPRSLPDAPEFKNLWAVHSWKLVPMLRGFNLRAEAANRLIRDGKKLDAARRMSDLLRKFRDRLDDAWDLLYRLRPHKSADDVMSISLEVNLAVNDRLTMIDPIGLIEGSVDLDWLAFETEHIHPDRFDEVLERDLAYADAQEEMRQSSTDAIFERLDHLDRLKRKLDE